MGVNVSDDIKNNKTTFIGGEAMSALLLLLLWTYDALWLGWVTIPPIAADLSCDHFAVAVVGMSDHRP